MKPTALITGASSGIGLEFAKILAQQNYNLVLVARSTDKLQQLASELNQTDVTIISKDLSLQESTKEVYEELKQKNISIDVLINNAGFGDYGLFHETDWKKEAMMIDLNVRSLTYMTYLFGSDMVHRKNGKIVNVASTAAFQAGPLMSVYYASKAYVLNFSIGLANEWKDFGVTVTALCPGPTESRFRTMANVDDSPLFKGRKIATSKEVAEFGFEALMQGKVVAIHGFMNRMMAKSTRLIPHTWAAAIARKVQEK